MAFEDLFNKFKEKVDSVRTKATAKATETVKEVRESVSLPLHKEKVDEKMWIDIRTMTVVRVVLVTLALIYLAQVIQQVGNIVFILLLSVIVASAIGPVVDRWQTKGMNRVAAAVIIYVIVLAVLTIIISSFIPVIGRQIMDLATNFQVLLAQFTNPSTDGTIMNRVGASMNDLFQQVDREQLVAQFQGQLQSFGSSLLNVAGNVWRALGSIFGGLFYAITVLILSFYMVIQKHSFEEFISTLAPSRYEPYVMEKSHLVREKMGAWLRAQLLVCSIIACIAFIGLAILGVPYALTLALFAGLMAIVPYLGPLLGAMPSILIGLSVSPWTALFVIILFFVFIQFLESNLITPLIMRRAVGLNPVTIITVLLIGGSLFGIPGILLAIPITTAIKVFTKDFQHTEDAK